MMEKEKKSDQPTDMQDDAVAEGLPGEYPQGKGKRGAESLPHCRTAPDPEHFRAEDEDEPCDDYRSGDVPGDEEK